jgi:exodeoxyribonuclease VII small subunit
MGKETQKLNYEEAAARLETIVRQMEAGSLSLDESVKAYEEGLKLVKFCEKELNKYEKLLRGNSDGDGESSGKTVSEGDGEE